MVWNSGSWGAFYVLQRFRTVHVQVSTSVMWQEGAREEQITWHPLLAYKTPVGNQKELLCSKFLESSQVHAYNLLGEENQIRGIKFRLKHG